MGGTEIMQKVAGSKMEIETGKNATETVATGSPGESLLMAMLSRLMVIARELKNLNARQTLP